jgi:hypothetical protein
MIFLFLSALVSNSDLENNIFFPLFIDLFNGEEYAEGARAHTQK